MDVLALIAVLSTLCMVGCIVVLLRMTLRGAERADERERAGSEPFLAVARRRRARLNAASAARHPPAPADVAAWLEPDFEALEAKLRRAAARRDLAEVDRWLALGADPNAPDRLGATALHRAVRGSTLDTDGRVPVARRLLAAGADVNARDHEGRTALHYVFGAIGFGYSFAMAELLLAAGADPTVLDRHDCRPGDHDTEIYDIVPSDFEAYGRALQVRRTRKDELLAAGRARWGRDHPNAVP